MIFNTLCLPAAVTVVFELSVVYFYDENLSIFAPINPGGFFIYHHV
jgi:hypothetical protein